MSGQYSNSIHRRKLSGQYGVLTEESWKKIKKEFSGRHLEIWIKLVEELHSFGLMASSSLGIVNVSIAIAKVVGVNAAIQLAETSIFVFKKAGTNAASSLISNAPRSSLQLESSGEFENWLTSIRELAVAAPQHVTHVCSQGEYLLSRLDATGFRNWIVAGLTSTGHDGELQTKYFSLIDPDSLNVINSESSEVRLATLERRLLAILAGLWRLSPTIRPAEIKEAFDVPIRTSFDHNFIRCPRSFPGFRSEHAESLFKAAITHIGAHMVFSVRKLEAKSLKPLQIALISVLEDTRVELIAGRRFPGLLKNWRSFHVVQPDGPLLANSLLARLSRALIDPEYQDDNSWIVKARQLVGAHGFDWDDIGEIRRLGVILGNDLGQMRVQFNPKTYVVQPPYRDDNLGVWDFGELPPESLEDQEIVHGSIRIEQTNDREQPFERQRETDNLEEESAATLVRETDPDTGFPVSRQHEWDYVAGCDRLDWVTIMEYEPRTAPASIITYLLSQHIDIKRRITSLISEARIGRPIRLRRQLEGDRLDMDACIRAQIDRISGLPAEDRIYENTALLHRDLSVLVLLDVSESTKDLINGTATSVFSIERSATALLAHAMDQIGDPFAIHAFCSNGRSDLRYCRIKDFNSVYDDACKERLAGLKPGLSTRMGAALRHAGSQFSQQVTHRKLVLVVTDGEPSDVDIQDKKYLVEDARKAVHELARQGIDVFCVGLDGSGDTYLSRIFGRRNAVQIDRVESLPEKLPMIYFRLVS